MNYLGSTHYNQLQTQAIKASSSPIRSILKDPSTHKAKISKKVRFASQDLSTNPSLTQINTLKDQPLKLISPNIQLESNESIQLKTVLRPKYLGKNRSRPNHNREYSCSVPFRSKSFYQKLNQFYTSLKPTTQTDTFKPVIKLIPCSMTSSPAKLRREATIH